MSKTQSSFQEVSCCPIFPVHRAELETNYCDELPNGNYPNPGLAPDVDTRCSYIACSNQHTYLFHCPQGKA